MMELPNLFVGSENKDKKFIVMVLSDCTIQAALATLSPPNDDGSEFSEDETPLSSVQVLFTSSVKDFDSVDECVVAADRALQELGAESEDVNEVVFGFEPSWVSPAGIADDKKPLLKKLTTELSLKALGFVVTTEAVFQHLKEAEPLISTLVLCLTPTSVVVVLVKQGVMVGVETVGRSNDIAADVAEAIARFKQAKDLPHVPPQFLVLAAGITETELVAQQQSLITYDWITNQEFLQQPTVDTLSSQSLIEVVATQGGRAVLGASVGNTVSQEVKKSNLESSTNQVSEELKPLPEGDNFGFVSVAEEPSEESAFEDTATAEPERVVSNFGIPIGGKTLDEWEMKTNGNGHTPENHEHANHAVKTHTSHHVSSHHGSNKKTLNSIKTFVQHHKVFIGVGFGLGLLALAILAGVASTVMAKVIFTVVPKQQTVTLDVPIRLSSTATTSDPTNKVLAATTVTKELTGQASVTVGGVKVVGEPAKGTVTMVNKTDSVKTFAAGTVVSAGKMSFALDKEVTVASASVVKQGSSGETKTYGKTDVAVTARAVGEDGNLGKDTVLKVADFANSTYEAVITSGLSGGSSREARVVSEQDRTKAITELKAKLVEQAATAWKEESGQGKYFAPTGKVTVKDSDYDKKVGDEAESLNVGGTVVVEALAYEASELEKLAAAALQQQLPQGFVLVGNKPNVLSTPAAAATNSATITLNANMSQQAQAQLDSSSWSGELLNKELPMAVTTLQQKQGVNTVTVVVEPTWLTSLVKKVPGNTNKVEIKITGSN